MHIRACKGSSDSEFLASSAYVVQNLAIAAQYLPYLNSIFLTIYRDPLQTLLRKPSFCVSLLKLSSLSPMARTKPERA
jgi:hypothetical protein